MDKRIFITYCTILFVSIIALYAIKYLNISYPLSVTTQSSELAVIGQGKVESVPDTATISVGITIYDSKSVDEVQKRINEINNTILKKLKELGLTKKNITTSNYSIYPNYFPQYNTNTQEKDKKYEGSVTLTIRTNKLNLVSKIIAKATEAGANTIQGVSYEIENPSILRQKARDMAIEDAKTQAQHLSKKLGIKLGKITNIVESSSEQVYPLYAKSASIQAGGGGGGEANLEPGTQTVTSTVTLYFEKK